ncbi:MAG: hypothetical protein ACXW0T_10225 [Methylobacter sp.]
MRVVSDVEPGTIRTGTDIGRTGGISRLEQGIGLGGFVFLPEDREGISKFAFVGDEKCKDEAFIFTGKPMHKTAIEFFSQDELSRQKLGYLEDNTHLMFLD